MSKGNIRVGIIGIGWFALGAHIPHLRDTGKVELVAICRRNQDRLQQAKKELGVSEAYSDWRQMLDRSKLDAVIVCTPHNAHAEPTIAALEHGLHVLVEKPMALTGKDAWAMVKAAEEASCVLMVGFDDRLRGCWRAAKGEIEKGAIGQLRQINVASCADFRWFWEKGKIPESAKERLKSEDLGDVFFGDLLGEDYWRSKPSEMGGGLFVDVGSHVIDLILWLSGSSPAQVVAFQESAGLPVDCFVTTQAQLVDGGMVSFTYGAGVSGDGSLFYGDGRMTIYGDGGLITADWKGLGTGNAQIFIEAEGNRKRVEDLPELTPAGTFVEAIVEGKPNPVPGWEAAHEVAFAEAAYQSIAEGKIIQIKSPAVGKNT